MRTVWQSSLVIGILLALQGCLVEVSVPAQPDLKQTLTEQERQSALSTVQCNLCHEDSKLSATHGRHLLEGLASQDQNGALLNGAVSCTDCHLSAVQYRHIENAGVHQFLPIFEATTEALRAGYVPEAGAEELFGFVNMYLDTLKYRGQGAHFPPQKTRDSRAGGTHADGKVDLVFAPNVVDQDALKQRGASGPWNPSLYTCEAMKCHSGYDRAANGNLYQWRSPRPVEEED